MKMYIVGYDVWGNEEEGFDVNDIYRYYDYVIDVPYDIKEEEVLELVKKWGCINPKLLENVSVCLWDENFIEFEDKETGKPLFRLEAMK